MIRVCEEKQFMSFPDNVDLVPLSLIVFVELLVPVYFEVVDGPDPEQDGGLLRVLQRIVKVTFLRVQELCTVFASLTSHVFSSGGSVFSAELSWATLVIDVIGGEILTCHLEEPDEAVVLALLRWIIGKVVEVLLLLYIEADMLPVEAVLAEFVAQLLEGSTCEFPGGGGLVDFDGAVCMRSELLF